MNQYNGFTPRAAAALEGAQRAAQQAGATGAVLRMLHQLGILTVKYLLILPDQFSIPSARIGTDQPAKTSR